jgi:hypothetical protein
MTLLARRGNTQFLRTRQPKECITMLTATQNTKTDPIFAAIETHRQATAARYPILATMMATMDGAPERWAMETAQDKATGVEIAATVELRKIQPTTIAGVMAVTAYFAEHVDRYPGCGWIGGNIAYDDPCWFGDGLIRNLAGALAKIGV